MTSQTNRTSLLVANQRFQKMLESAHKQGYGPKNLDDYTLIGLDPGETTGFAYRTAAKEGFTIHLEQIETKEIGPGMDNILAALTRCGYQGNIMLIVEDYRVYGWKADSHKWAGLHTPKLIGAIEFWAHLHRLPMVYQMANEAKTWATDENLKAWDLYDPGMKHARDASRHIITWAFHGKLPT